MRGSDHDATRRSDFARWFSAAAFPATVAEMRAEAWAARAPEPVVDLLAAADGDIRVDSVSTLYDVVTSRTGLA